MSRHRPGRTAGRAGYVVGALLLAAALLLCCGGGGWFAGPVMRASQAVERSVVGLAYFQMHQGDDYWLYQSPGGSWPDPVECVDTTDERRYVVSRAEPPFGAAETRTESGQEYEFFGTLRGDQSQTVVIECPGDDDYLVVASRAPRWYLLAAVAGGIVCGLLGLILAVVTAVRRRSTATSRRGGTVAAAHPVPAAPATGATAARTGPSPLWYVAVLPLVAVAVLACGMGLLGGISTGFDDSFDAPEVGQRRSGAVGDAFRHDDVYLLYANVDDPPPAEPIACRLSTDTGEGPLPIRTDRPFGAPGTVSNGDGTFQFFAAFQIPEPVLGTVICDGNSTLLSRPSNRPQLIVWTGLGVAVGALLAAGAVGTFVFGRRRRAARSTA